MVQVEEGEGEQPPPTTPDTPKPNTTWEIGGPFKPKKFKLKKKYFFRN
jgi:hypothetical protein